MIMEQAQACDDVLAPNSNFVEEKEAKVQLDEERKLTLDEEPFFEELAEIFGSSEEELNIYNLQKDGGVRNMSSHRQRSLISTLRYLHKGSRSSHTSEAKDWGFLASRRKRRTLLCTPRPCSCFTTEPSEELDDVCASKEEQSFQTEIETKARKKFQIHSWQDIKNGMKVDVSENSSKQTDLELYLYKRQLTLYEEKVKPRYIINLEDVDSVSYLKNRLPNTEPVQEPQCPSTIKGIVLDVSKRGSLQIMCNSQDELEKLAVALRTNHLIMNDPSIKASPRDHPIGEKEVRISATKFHDKARSGDIILFQTDNMSGKVIRKFTSGEYDHIAMVFNFSSGKCGIVESLQNTGVAAFL